MQAITRFFVDRWQFTGVLFALLIALGVGAVIAIPKSEDPITEFPGASVSVVLPGADAEQMERLVAIPLEDAFNAHRRRQRYRIRSRAPASPWWASSSNGASIRQRNTARLSAKRIWCARLCRRA